MGWLLSGQRLRSLLRRVAAALAARPALPGWEAPVSGLLLVLAVGFNLYHLYPEATISAPVLHDGVLHLAATAQAATALAAGQDPTDAWLPGIVMGYPLFHYYQHLPHVVTAALASILRVSLGPFPLGALLAWITYLLLSLFPLAMYWSARRFDLDRLPAALTGLVASVISTNGLFGFDYGSYVWRGFGLYSQLWGMLLVPLALAQGYAALRHGRGYFWAVLLLVATALSNLIFAFVAFASMALLGVLAAPREGLWRGLVRLLLLLVPLALATSYLLVPLLLDSAYSNHSVWRDQEKYDSFGHERILGMLVRGELFDFGRFPSLTILAGIGALFCLWRWREPRYRAPLALTVVWLLVYFGRPTWGALLDVTPLSREFHFHRLSAGVHLGAIYLMGLGLALPWQWALSCLPPIPLREGGGEGETRHALTRPPRRVGVGRRLPQGEARFAAARGAAPYLLLPMVLTALLLVPVYRERAAYLDYNKTLMLGTRDAFAREQRDVSALLATIEDGPPGRVYAGLAGTWGGKYRVGEVPMQALLTQRGFDTHARLYHSWSLPGDVQNLLDESRFDQYSLFNLRYVIAPPDRTFPDFVRPVRDFGRHRLYEVDTTGYFDLVDAGPILVGTKNDFYPPAARWLAGGQPGAKEHPILTFGGAKVDGQQIFSLAGAEALVSQATQPFAPRRGRILSEAVGSNLYQAQVEVARESTLMLKVTYHPNWHAYVDGVEARTVMLMPSFVGVPMSPGTHQVRMEYRPQPLRGYLMLLGLLALVVTAVAERKRAALAWVAERLPLARLPAPGPAVAGSAGRQPADQARRREPSEE